MKASTMPSFLLFSAPYEGALPAGDEVMRGDVSGADCPVWLEIRAEYYYY